MMTTISRSIRLEESKFKEIDDQCKLKGCNRNDFIKNAIDNELNGSNSKIKQEPQAQEANSDYEEPKLKVEVLLDSEIKDPSKIMHFRYAGNGKYIQDGVEESKACSYYEIE